MDKCIYAIGKDFKVAMHEYDEENNSIGAQCSLRCSAAAIPF